MRNKYPKDNSSPLYVLIDLLTLARRSTLSGATTTFPGTHGTSQSSGSHCRLRRAGQLPPDRELVGLNAQMDGLVTGLEARCSPPRNKLLGGRYGLAGGGSDSVASGSHVLEGVGVGSARSSSTGTGNTY